ncbi:MAG: response regulator transcription factor [Pontiella sp.]
MNNPINILLIEDSPEYREVVSLAIENESGMELVNKFGAAEVALRSLQDPSSRSIPDLVLLDLNLPGMHGLDAIPWIIKYAPNAKIIILTQSNKEADVLRAISLGAAGYLLKASTLQQIKEGIRSVIAGHSLLDKGVAHYLLNTLKNKPAQLTLEKPLSEREMEILHLLAEGLLKKEIANQLNIGFGTVATHVRHIYEKLQVVNAPAAIHKAHRIGIFQRPNKR